MSCESLFHADDSAYEKRDQEPWSTVVRSFPRVQTGSCCCCSDGADEIVKLFWKIHGK